MSDTPAPANADQPISPTESAPPKPLIQPRYIYLGLAALVIAVVVIVLLVILAIRNPVHTETFRDIAIIALAAESALIGLALLVLITQVARLTSMLEFEIKPIIRDTADTVSTVRGTAAFMSEHVVSPVIRVSSLARGIARLTEVVGSLFSVGAKRPATNSGEDDETQPTEGGER